MKTLRFGIDTIVNNLLKVITDFIFHMIVFFIKPVVQIVYKKYRKYKKYSIRKQNRIKRDFMRKAIILSTTCVLGIVFAFTLSAFASDVNAENNEKLHKYYTFYDVAPGDSLWEIADSYYVLGYENQTDYIEEVMFINHLDNPDDIISGDSLVIPYYSYEIK